MIGGMKNNSLQNIKTKLSRDVWKWGLGREQVLNLIAPPYSSCGVLLELVLDYLYSGKSVLYITEEGEDNIQMVEQLKKFSTFRDYSYARKSSSTLKTRLVFSNYERALRFSQKFNLVIYDDSRVLPRYSSMEIIDVMLKNVMPEGKLLSFSLEGIFKREREMQLPAYESGMPLAEPRILTTRLDINQDIPTMVYEFLCWFMENDERVIVYTPDEDKAEAAYNCLQSLNSRLGGSIILQRKHKDSIKVIDSFKKMKKAILITDYHEEPTGVLRDTSILVYFAENVVFDYKKFVHFCGKISKEGGKGEVLLLSSYSSPDMERAKEITRGFNKEAWEEGLLQL